jgi:hypothetical protein
MTKQNTNLLKVLIRQIAQDAEVDPVFAESRLILTEAEASQPTPEVDDGTLNSLTLMIAPPSRQVQGSSLSGR